MFDIGAPEFLTLVVLAVIIFGPDKLPELARKAARVIRYVRTIANDAKVHVREEMGETWDQLKLDDLQAADLKPRALARKYLLDTEEAGAVLPATVDYVKTAANDATSQVREGIGQARDALQRGDPQATDVSPNV